MEVLLQGVAGNLMYFVTGEGSLSCSSSRVLGGGVVWEIQVKGGVVKRIT